MSVCFPVLLARSTHIVVAGFVDVFFDVIGGDGIFLNGAYCNFCCSFTVKYEVFYTKRAIRDFFVNDQELSM